MDKQKTILFAALFLILVGGIGSYLSSNDLVNINVREKSQFNAADIREVEIRVNNGSVELRKENGDAIVAELSGKQRPAARLSLNAETKNGKLVLSPSHKGWFPFSIFGRFSDVKLVVVLPEQPLHALEVEVNNGSLKAESVYAEAIRAKVNNSNASLHAAGAMVVSAHVRNGDLDFAADTADMNLDLRADNGDVIVTLPEEPQNAAYDARAANGKVVFFGNRKYPDVVGSGTHLIKLRATNGDVILKTP